MVYVTAKVCYYNNTELPTIKGLKGKTTVSLVVHPDINIFGFYFKTMTVIIKTYLN